VGDGKVRRPVNRPALSLGLFVSDALGLAGVKHLRGTPLAILSVEVHDDNSKTWLL
jgi:hypothetical protein